MKKRIFAVLLVLALIMTVSAVAVFATDGTATKSETNVATCPCHGYTVDEIDAYHEAGDTTLGWTEWTGTFEDDKHYRLSDHVTGKSRAYLGGDSDGSVAVQCLLNLNNFNITQAGNNRFVNLGAGDILTIVGSGEIKGHGNGGCVVMAAPGSIFNLYEATLSNARDKDTYNEPGGVVEMGKGTSASYAVFNMYSGTLNGNESLVQGGAVSLRQYSQFNMHGGTINGATATGKSGGAVYMYSGATFNMDDGEINGGSAADGGAIYVNAAQLNLNGGTVNGSTVTGGGGAIYVTGTTAVVKIAGTTINGGTATNGGAIYNNNGKVTMSSGKIDGGEASNNGGAVYYYAAAGTRSFDMTGGSIENGTATGNGGNFYISRSNLKQSKGTITGGSANQGGNVYAEGAEYSPSVIISGSAQITNGTATENGGNVAVVGSAKAVGMQWQGGTVSGGNAKLGGNIYVGGPLVTLTITGGTSQNGSVYVNADTPVANVNVSSNPVIDELDLSANQITLGALDADALIGVTKAVNTNFAVGAEDVDISAYTKNFYGATTNRNAVADTAANALYLVAVDCPHCDTPIEDIVWTKWKLTNGGESNTISADAHYYVTKDVTTVGSMIRIGKALTYGPDVVIDLRGYEISTNSNVRVFAVYHGGALSIMDSVGGGSVIGNLNNAIGGTILLNQDPDNNENTQTTKTRLNIYGGTIANKRTSSTSGGTVIYGYANTAVNIENATITGVPTTGRGSAIYTAGELNISGGNISGSNSDGLFGGCIYLLSTSKTHISGGTITGGDIGSYANITVSGKPTISNLNFVETSAQLVIGELIEGANITVYATVDTPFSVANETLTEDVLKYFYSGVDGVDVVLVDGRLMLKTPAKMAVCDHCGGEAVEWFAINTATPVEFDKYKGFASGHYYLSDNYDATFRVVLHEDAETVANPHTPTTKLCIDLNGYTWTQTDGAQAFWTRSTTADLAIMDLSGTNNGKVTNDFSTSATNGYGTTVYMTNGVFSLYGGTLENTGAGVYGGGLIGNSSGTVTVNIEGGTITGGKAKCHGGSIAIKGSGSKLNISGDAIIENGYVECSLTTEKDGKISPVIPQGGNIYCEGTFTMTGGTITGGSVKSTNGAIPRGGNIYLQGGANNHVIAADVDNGKTVVISDGVAIDGNGGNVYVGGGALTVGNGATITDGESQRAQGHTNGGGNVYGLGNTTITIESGAVISNGKAVSYGANVMTRGTVNIQSKASLVNGQSEAPFGDELFGSYATLNIDDLGEAWSGDVAMTDDCVLTGDTVGANLAVYTKNRAFEIWYATLDEVLAGDVEDIADDPETEEDETYNTYIKLSADGELTLSGDHIVDLDGHTATLYSDGTLTCFDSDNDEYQTYGAVTLAADPLTSFKAPNGNLYITFEHEDGSYSFHRLAMTFKKLSLRPSVGGVYYSATWKCDDVLAGTLGEDYDPVITGYGMALKKGTPVNSGSFTDSQQKFAYTYTDNVNGIENNFLCNNIGEEINSCLLYNIINTTNGAKNQTNAEVVVCATPYVEILNYKGLTEYIVDVSYNNSLKGIVEYFVETIDAMDDEDPDKAEGIKGLYEFYKTWCLEEAYCLNDFFTGLKDLVAPAETPTEPPVETPAE